MALQPRIVIAAGHGGGDPGAVGQGSTEATEDIQISRILADKLRADGRFEVVYVDDALNLGPEIDWINAHYRNLLDGLALEIHKNAGGGHGSEVLYYDGDATSLSMAQQIAAALGDVTGLPNRGVKADDNAALVARIGGPLGWTRNVKMYSLLIECGFVDSDPISDAADERFAEGVYQGILRVYGLAGKQTTPSVPQQPAAPPVNPVNLAYTPLAGVATVVASAGASVRSAPLKDAPRSGSQVLAEGATFNIKGYVHGEDVDLTAQGYLHTDIWIMSEYGNFVTAAVLDVVGRLIPSPAAAAPAPPPPPLTPPPAPTPPAAPAIPATPEVPVIPERPKPDYMTSYVDAPEERYTRRDCWSFDVAAGVPYKKVDKGTLVSIAGTMEHNGQRFYRSAAALADNRWTGLPEIAFEAEPQPVPVKTVPAVPPATSAGTILDEPDPWTPPKTPSAFVQFLAWLLGPILRKLGKKKEDQ